MMRWQRRVLLAMLLLTVLSVRIAAQTGSASDQDLRRRMSPCTDISPLAEGEHAIDLSDSEACGGACAALLTDVARQTNTYFTTVKFVRYGALVVGGIVGYLVIVMATAYCVKKRRIRPHFILAARVLGVVVAVLIASGAMFVLEKDPARQLRTADSNLRGMFRSGVVPNGTNFVHCVVQMEAMLTRSDSQLFATLADYPGVYESFRSIRADRRAPGAAEEFQRRVADMRRLVTGYSLDAAVNPQAVEDIFRLNGMLAGLRRQNDHLILLRASWFAPFLAALLALLLQILTRGLQRVWQRYAIRQVLEGYRSKQKQTDSVAVSAGQ
jgi:hypothetical protein